MCSVRSHSCGCQHDGNCSFSSAVLICNFENISVSANSLSAAKRLINIQEQENMIHTSVCL